MVEFLYVSRKVIKYKKKADLKPRVAFNIVINQDDMCYELEINKFSLKVTTIYDDGTFPEPAINSCRDIFSFSRKLRADFVEISISRKKTLFDLLQKMKKLLITESLPNTNFRLYLHRGLIDPKDYSMTLDDYTLERKTEDCSLAYLELSLPGGGWPTEKRAATDSSSTKQFSSGLINLGNSIQIQFIIIACYMNATLQCLFNTKFIKDYLIKGDYEKHINVKNVLGKHGEIITSFALLVF